MPSIITVNKKAGDPELNRVYNACVSERLLGYERNSFITKQMQKKIEQVNQICVKNGLPSFEVDLKFKSRSQVSSIISHQIDKLNTLGIDVPVLNVTLCKDCKCFKPTIGEAGICSKYHCTKRTNKSCAGAERKEAN